MIELVTGASGSGKSEYAEQLAMDAGPFPRIYLATMMIWDEEGKKRAARHQAMRAGKGFATLECFTGLSQLRFEGKPVVLLECMSNLVSNEFCRLREKAGIEIRAGIENLEKQCRTVVVVTNEVFSDGVSYGEETGRYIRILGEINRYLGERAETVTEVVCGIPVKVK